MSYNAKPNRPTKYKSGNYKLLNETKYIANPDKIIYRSGLEYQFCVYADKNPNILKWGSEIIGIPYTMYDYNTNTNRNHTYYMDYYLEVKNENHPTGMERWLIEVKPETEYLAIIGNTPPEKPKKCTPKAIETWEYGLKMFITNKHKWAAAKEYARRNHMIFYVVTEKVLAQLFK